MQCLFYKPIGFDIHGNDSDAGALDYRTAWDKDESQDSLTDLESQAFQNRSVFGIINNSILGCHFDCLTPPCPDDICNPTLNNFIVSQKPQIYPNPAAGLVYFKNMPEIESVEIINLSGIIVYKADIKDEQADLSMLEKGIYFLKVGNDFIKLIKQ